MNKEKTAFSLTEKLTHQRFDFESAVLGVLKLLLILRTVDI